MTSPRVRYRACPRWSQSRSGAARRCEHTAHPAPTPRSAAAHLFRLPRHAMRNAGKPHGFFRYGPDRPRHALDDRAAARRRRVGQRSPPPLAGACGAHADRGGRHAITHRVHACAAEAGLALPLRPAPVLLPDGIMRGGDVPHPQWRTRRWTAIATACPVRRSCADRSAPGAVSSAVTATADARKVYLAP